MSGNHRITTFVFCFLVFVSVFEKAIILLHLERKLKKKEKDRVSIPNRVFSRGVTAAMLVSPTNPLGIQLYHLMLTFSFVLAEKYAH